MVTRAICRQKAVVVSDATTVLLIDDDPTYRDYYTQRLYASATNYDVVHAATGRSGLDICARRPIDCVVLEIDLPDMSGFEVLAKLVPRTYHPEIGVIVVTRLFNQFLLDLTIKNGAQAAFQKTAGCGDLLEPSIVKAISTVQLRNRLVS
jgi:DNA-binding NarL/FixJ family response regulator